MACYSSCLEKPYTIESVSVSLSEPKRKGCAGEGGLARQMRYKIYPYRMLVAFEVGVSYMKEQNILPSVGTVFMTMCTVHRVVVD